MNIMNVTLFVCVTSATWRRNFGKVVGAWGQRSPVTMIILNGLMKCFYGVRFSLIILPLLSFFVLLIQTSFCLGESVQPWGTKGEVQMIGRESCRADSPLCCFLCLFEPLPFTNPGYRSHTALVPRPKLFVAHRWRYAVQGYVPAPLVWFVQLGR